MSFRWEAGSRDSRILPESDTLLTRGLLARKCERNEKEDVLVIKVRCR